VRFTDTRQRSRRGHDRPVPPRERPTDRGARLARFIRNTIGLELREARVGAGLTQRAVGRAIGIAASEVSRIEAGRRATVSVDRLARFCAVVGLDLSVRTYPVGPPIRDAGHLRLIGRFRERVSSGGWIWRAEVPVAGHGDQRAWDGQLTGLGLTIATEMETRLRDIQAMQRRIELKRRDAAVDRVLLVVADTRANRAAIAAAAGVLSAAYPVSARTTLVALAAGRDPGGDALLVL
jgi:transcriptional regulator with XRE-family HTH domain